MDTVLQILTLCTSGCVFLILIALTAIIAFFVLKLKSRSAAEAEKKNSESDDYNQALNTNIDDQHCACNAILQKIDAAKEDLLCELKEIRCALNEKNSPGNEIRELKVKVADLETKLNAEINTNGELIARIKELEVENKTADDEKAVEPDEREAYYMQILADEQKLRAGIRKSMELLINSRGSNSIDFYAEQIEIVIKTLSDSNS